MQGRQRRERVNSTDKEDAVDNMKDSPSTRREKEKRLDITVSPEKKETLSAQAVQALNASPTAQTNPNPTNPTQAQPSSDQPSNPTPNATLINPTQPAQKEQPQPPAPSQANLAVPSVSQARSQPHTPRDNGQTAASMPLVPVTVVAPQPSALSASQSKSRPASPHATLTPCQAALLPRSSQASPTMPANPSETGDTPRSPGGTLQSEVLEAKMMASLVEFKNETQGGAEGERKRAKSRGQLSPRPQPMPMPTIQSMQPMHYLATHALTHQPGQDAQSQSLLLPGQEPSQSLLHPLGLHSLPSSSSYPNTPLTPTPSTNPLQSLVGSNPLPNPNPSVSHQDAGQSLPNPLPNTLANSNALTQTNPLISSNPNLATNPLPDRANPLTTPNPLSHSTLIPNPALTSSNPFPFAGQESLLQPFNPTPPNPFHNPQQQLNQHQHNQQQHNQHQHNQQQHNQHQHQHNQQQHSQHNQHFQAPSISASPYNQHMLLQPLTSTNPGQSQPTILQPSQLSFPFSGALTSPTPYPSSNPLPIFHSQGGTPYQVHGHQAHAYASEPLMQSTSPTRFAHTPIYDGSFLGQEHSTKSRTTSPADSPLHSANGLDAFPLVGSLSRRELLQSGPLLYPSNTSQNPTPPSTALTPLPSPLAHTSHSNPELSAVFTVASKLMSQQAPPQQRFPSLLNSAFEDIVTQMDEKRERRSLDDSDPGLRSVSMSGGSGPTASFNSSNSNSTNGSLHNSNATEDDDPSENKNSLNNNNWNKKQFVIIDDYASNFEHDSSRVPLARSLDGSNDATKSL
jgi:hypothetical protein